MKWLTFWHDWRRQRAIDKQQRVEDEQLARDLLQQTLNGQLSWCEVWDAMARGYEADVRGVPICIQIELGYLLLMARTPDGLLTLHVSGAVKRRLWRYLERQKQRATSTSQAQRHCNSRAWMRKHFS
jgi:hypothetical protein